MPTAFKPIVPFEKGPSRISDRPDIRGPQRVDLRELPLDTIIEFSGTHPASTYVCLLVGPESDRQIKIWFNPECNGAIGSIDNLVSHDLSSGIPPQIGVLEIGKNYGLPHFYYDLDCNIQVVDQIRIERYTKIFVKRPSS